MTPSAALPGDRRAERLLALSAFAFASGMILTLLSAAREPAAGKVIPHGVLAGLQIVSLSYVLLAASYPDQRPVRRIGVSILTAVWLVSLALDLLLLFPDHLTNTVVAYLVQWFPEYRVRLVFSVLGVMGERTVAVHQLVGFLVIIEALLVVGVRRGRWSELGRAVLLGSSGALVASIPLVDDWPASWTAPPLTLNPLYFGTAAVIGVAVALWASPVHAGGAVAPMATVQGDADASARPRRALVISLVVAMTWLAVVTPLTAAARTQPPDFIVEAQQAFTDLPSDGLAERILGEVLGRLGVTGDGLRLRVRYVGPFLPPLQHFNSIREFREDGSVLISVNGQIPTLSRRNYLGYQLSAALIDAYFPGTSPVLAAGFAYWAGGNVNNPFAEGTFPHERPEDVCAALARIDFSSVNDQMYVPSTLPFILAAREGGVEAARSLFRQLRADRTSMRPDSWRQRISADCRSFLGGDVSIRPELQVQASPEASGLAGDGITEAAFAEAKARTGLDGFGRTFTVRYDANVGPEASSSFPSRRDVTVNVRTDLSPTLRHDALVALFAASFVTVRYGNDISPVVDGFASWAAQDSRNPFVEGARSRYTPIDVCRLLPTTNLRERTLGTTWLASLPFIEAERQHGVEAAQGLLHRTLGVGRLDQPAWRARIEQSCAAITG